MDNAIGIAVGLFCVVIGVLNIRGHISMLHSYHRKNVSDEDIMPFGKQIGAGTIIMGLAIVLNGVLCIASEVLEKGIIAMVGQGVMAVGLCVGVVIVVNAMRKYNGGIFKF